MTEKHYFLGSSTAEGFVGTVNEITDNTRNTVCILKGTAGSGKSTLMKKIAEAFTDCEKELFFCSADPYSLDAVYIKDKGFMIIDGTAPHCLDPVYPKAVQSIVDLGAYLETAPLRAKKSEIVDITDKYSTYHKRSRLILSAAASVISDVAATAASAIDYRRLGSFTSRTVKRLQSGRHKTEKKGLISHRQLSAITFNGYSTFIPRCQCVYLLNDSFGAAADIFLRSAAEQLSAAGFEVIVSRCLISKEKSYEHILIPELDTAFITSGFLSDTIIDNAKIINFKRFYTSEISDKAKPARARVRFGRKAVRELLAECSKELKAAKAVHDKIEEYYILAADHDSLNRLAYKLISDIKSL